MLTTFASRTTRIALTTVALGGLVAGCGSSSSNTSNSTSSSSFRGDGVADEPHRTRCLPAQARRHPSFRRWSGWRTAIGRTRRRVGFTSRRRTPRGRLPRWWRQHLEVPGRPESVRRELPRGTTPWSRHLAPGHPELRHLCAPARLQPPEPQLLRKGPRVPVQHPLERQVPDGQQGVPERARPGRRGRRRVERVTRRTKGLPRGERSASERLSPTLGRPAPRAATAAAARTELRRRHTPAGYRPRCGMRPRIVGGRRARTADRHPAPRACVDHRLSPRTTARFAWLASVPSTARHGADID